jgi:hypothetical protein
MHFGTKPYQFLNNGMASIHYTIQDYKLIQKGSKKEERISIKVKNFVPNSASSTCDKSCHTAKRPLMVCLGVRM